MFICFINAHDIPTYLSYVVVAYLILSYLILFYLSFYLSIYLSVCLSVCPSTYLSIGFLYLSIYSCNVYVFTYLSMCIFINFSFYLPIYISYIDPCLYLSIYLSIYIYVYIYICSSMYLFTNAYLYRCFCVYLSIPFVYRSLKWWSQIIHTCSFSMGFSSVNHPAIGGPPSLEFPFHEGLREAHIWAADLLPLRLMLHGPFVQTSDVHTHGGTPIAGWLLLRKIQYRHLYINIHVCI